MNHSSLVLLPFSDSGIVQTLPVPVPPPPLPPETPHSFSYLLSMQDPIPDLSTFPLPDHLPDDRLHDDQLVETMSEDDRATLLPIIRIAFPSLRHSMQDPYSSWHSLPDDGIVSTGRQLDEMEGFHYQSMDIDRSQRGLHYRFLPGVDVHHSTSVYGVQPQEELRFWPVGEISHSVKEVEKLESSTRMEEFISQQRSHHGPSTVTDDKLSLSAASEYRGLNLLPNMARNASWVQAPPVPLVDESSELVYEGQFCSGPSSIDSASPHFEAITSKCNEPRDELQATLPRQSSHAQTSNESAQNVASEQEEGASFEMEYDMIAASSRPDEAQSDPIAEPVTVLKLHHVVGLSEVNRKRRNVIKKAVGWVRKRRTQSSSARVSHKRKCSSPCCAGYEVGSKRRKLSGHNSRGRPRKTHISSTLQAQPQKKSKDQVKATRHSNIVGSSKTDSSGTNASSVNIFPAMDGSSSGREAQHLTQDWVNSPLSTALFLVLLESGSHGVTVCEALRKLLKQGYAKLFNNSETRAVQVKMALRRCPDFKRLNTRRFILRNCRRAEEKPHNIKGSTHEECRSAAQCNKGEECLVMKGPCQKLQKLRTPGGYSENLARSSGAGFSAGDLRCHRQKQKPEQCRKTDGKQWRCPQKAKPGFLYCERHHQCRSKALKGHLRKSSHRDVQAQKLRVLQKEDQSRTVTDSCSGKSRHHSLGEEPKLDRCRRTDGRHWQCSKQVKPGSIYCEHHQGRCKKGKGKNSRPGQIASARDSKQELKVRKTKAVDSVVNGIKGKVKCIMHGQIRLGKELKQDLQEAEACASDRSQMRLKGKAKGIVHAKIAVAQETKRRLHMSEAYGIDMPQTPGACRLLEKSNCNGQGYFVVDEEAKQKMMGSMMGTAVRHTGATHGSTGKANCYGEANVHQGLQFALDMYQNSVVSWKDMITKTSENGEITEERDNSQALQTLDLRLTSSSTTLNGCYPSGKFANIQGKHEQQSERCHRSDGKKWQCSQQCQPGYIYCEHHQVRRYKSRDGVSGQVKVVVRKQLDKQVTGPCADNGTGSSVKHRSIPHAGKLSQMTGDCTESASAVSSWLVEAEHHHVKRCHRTDGKGWQCSYQAKPGFNYCEHHQVYLSKRATPKVSKKEKQTVPYLIQ